jgi:hypothetical protein
MKKMLALLLVTPFVSNAEAQAAEAGTVAQGQVLLTPLLTSEHVYMLLVFAIIGSLGVIGLLLGLDKLIVVFFNRNNGDNAVKKYSSEGIARMLPIVIEGITVILVILTVIILGASRIISGEGTLGILGSIVGYVLGKSSRNESTQKNASPA